MIGNLIAIRIQPPHAYDMGPYGALAGILAFVCLRLWFGDGRRKNSD
jgi:hypothetical protein